MTKHFSKYLNCKAANRLEKAYDNNDISHKVKNWINKTVQRCIDQLMELRKIDNLTFRAELITQRKGHYCEMLDNYTYWDNAIDRRWVRSYIIAICREQEREIQKLK